MIERIKHKGEEIAIIVRHDHPVEGAEFITDDANPLQVGMLRRHAGQIAPAHKHLYEPQVIDVLQEIIYVVEGKLRLTIYDGESEEVIKQTEMTAGDMVIHKKEAHGVEFLEETLIYEVKQGPYPGDKEAKVFLKKAKPSTSAS
jgi:quercetin dioxygenase-like cupin family protein